MLIEKVKKFIKVVQKLNFNPIKIPLILQRIILIKIIIPINKCISHHNLKLIQMIDIHLVLIMYNSIQIYNVLYIKQQNYMKNNKIIINIYKISNKI
jgi:hypothetical protein